MNILQQLVWAKKRLGLVIVLLVLWFSMVGNVQAQQQTGRVVPQTRNPQADINGTLQTQSSGIQSTGSDQVLRQSQTIEIPSGRAAVSSTDEGRGLGLGWLLFGLPMLILIGILAGLLYSSRKVSVPPVEFRNETTASSATHTTAVVKKPLPKKKKQSAKRSHKKRKKK